MKIKIQVVENSDRFHVSQNGIPQRTFIEKDYLSRPIANAIAKAFAYDLAVRKQDDGFDVTLLKQESK